MFRTYEPMINSKTDKREIAKNQSIISGTHLLQTQSDTIANFIKEESNKQFALEAKKINNSIEYIKIKVKAIKANLCYLLFVFIAIIIEIFLANYIGFTAPDLANHKVVTWERDGYLEIHQANEENKHLYSKY